MGRSRDPGNDPGPSFPVTQLRAGLDGWLSDTDDDLAEFEREAWAEKFCGEYRGVIRQARKCGEDLVDRVLRLQHFDDAGRSPTRVLLDYVNALSVEVGAEPVFIPSFTDRCLANALSNPALYLSPFRGLYYCWQLGEIAVLLNQAIQSTSHRVHLRDPEQRASKLLRRVAEEVDDDYRKQRDGVRYNAYYAYLEGLPESSQALALTLTEQVSHIKKAFDFGIKRKSRWCKLFLPYPSQHSTHFYLSGMRFYWNALHEAPGCEFGARGERYSVQSTSSGLTSPCERYGMLVPEDADSDAEAELLDLLPPGSLQLDFSPGSDPAVDLTNLKFFERWSRLVTARVHSMIVHVQELLDAAHDFQHCSKRARDEWTRLATEAYLTAVAKNPMRTFYFDGGLIAAAQSANIEPDGYPIVQYVTTRQSAPETPAAMRLFEEVKDACGEGLQIYSRRSEPFLPPMFPEFTLVPVGPHEGDQRKGNPTLEDATSYLWSIRDPDAKRITAGLEGRTSNRARYVAGQQLKKHLPDVAATSGLATAAAGAIAMTTRTPVPFPVEAILAVASMGLLFHSEFKAATRDTDKVRSQLFALPGDTRNWRYVESPADFV